MMDEKDLDRIYDASKWDVVSCDEEGNWLPTAVENKYEFDFFNMLHECSSYEEFMVKSDFMMLNYNLAYFGFESKDAFEQWIKDYYRYRQQYLKGND